MLIQSIQARHGFYAGCKRSYLNIPADRLFAPGRSINLQARADFLIHMINILDNHLETIENAITQQTAISLTLR